MDVIIIIIYGSCKILLFCYVGWMDSTTTTVDHATYYCTVMLDRWTIALKEPILHCVHFYFDILGEWTYTDHARYYYTVMLDGWTAALKKPTYLTLFFSVNRRTVIMQGALLFWKDGQLH